MLAFCARHERRLRGCSDIGVDDEILSGHSVTVCTGSLPRIQGGRVQVLADASASMGGFAAALPEITGWATQAISRLDGAALRVEEGRVCQFSTRLGIGACSRLMQPPQEFKAEAFTNLHQAVAAAKDYELTFIITDGVAAVGSGSGDCAAGVDAACIAHALLDVLKEFRYIEPASEPGIWVVPLVTRFQGRYYTETRGNPLALDPREVSSRVNDELGVTPFLGVPQAIRDGTITYDYRGPKVLLVLVIARTAEVGRQAVAALWERMTDFRVRPIGSFADVPNGIGVLHSLELYPGAVESLQWTAISEVDEPRIGIGNVDA
jgi:hypothetical protein